MHIDRVTWGGWENCIRLQNDHIELVITTELGPRIISCGRPGGKNLFHVDDATRGKNGGEDWWLYGGHRLWHAPEDPVRTYQPDNSPVTVETLSDTQTRFVTPIEAMSGIQKTITITLRDDGKTTVHHTLTNHGAWPLEFAVWSLSVMAPGSTAILPLPSRGEHPRDLLPNTRLIFWPYADLSDKRWTLGYEYILLRQETTGLPQKVGGLVDRGWLACANNGDLFVKWFDCDTQAPYPDMGCNAELFTNTNFLELESLGPIMTVEPGASISHTETWRVFAGVPVPTSDDDVRTHILPLIESV